ncbi:MAG: hypoxanthine phosphoribosyltransferase [Acidobacteria bacterium]|nr:MAG: hypoxanthine phosphoribosyltransferase [Acidobacteriota bacterium]
MSEFTNPNVEILISAEQIKEKIREMGADIARDYAGRNPLLIGVLKGACTFLSDLIRATDIPLGIEFIAISSYGAEMRTSGEVRILKDLDVAVAGRHILVVEDIVDTGLTLSYLLANLESRGAASVKLVALLDKYERREKDVPIDYLGFKIPDKFVVPTTQASCTHRLLVAYLKAARRADARFLSLRLTYFLSSRLCEKLNFRFPPSRKGKKDERRKERAKSNDVPSRSRYATAPSSW